MIYTLTLNPSLDYHMHCEQLELGHTNRSAEEFFLPGGKGINASLVFENFHIPSTTLGFVAGFTGRELIRLLHSYNLTTDFVEVAGTTRINIKFPLQESTEINAAGPSISANDIALLYKKLALLNDGDFLVLAGSLPSGLPITTYCNIMYYLSNKRINFVVDTSGEALEHTLSLSPWIVKPNLDELSSFFERPLHTLEDIKLCASYLQELGAKNVLVSLGSRGALLLSEDQQCYYCTAPKGTAINAVGAGDSMLAGFLIAYHMFSSSKDFFPYETNDRYEYAFMMSIYAGSASAFSSTFVTPADICSLYQESPLVPSIL